jgi:hypothetical protein
MLLGRERIRGMDDRMGSGKKDGTRVEEGDWSTPGPVAPAVEVDWKGVPQEGGTEVYSEDSNGVDLTIPH